MSFLANLLIISEPMQLCLIVCYEGLQADTQYLNYSFCSKLLKLSISHSLGMFKNAMKKGLMSCQH